jgi:arsenite methyltransferase
MFSYPTGRQGALLLGYDRDLLFSLPDAVLESFCGVGNPLAIAPVRPGAAILDIGCGAGFDLLVAARISGPGGIVCGVDLTPEMVERARANILLAGEENIEVRETADDRLPFADDLFDLVISNGVINLSPDKPGLFAEILRVLKTGGKLQFADIVLEKDLPPHLDRSVESWSQ